MTATAACTHCEHVGPVHKHHPTGRIQGRPNHDFVVPLCASCHQAEHRCWHFAGLEGEGSPPLFLRRLALHLDRRRRPLEAVECRALAAVLHNVAASLEEVGS